MNIILILAISIVLNIVFITYLVHDTIYYKNVIEKLQKKYRKLLEK